MASVLILKRECLCFMKSMFCLAKKEALLLKCLFLKSHGITSCDEIISLVYQNEIVSQERIRALIKQLRDKLPYDLIRTFCGKGYPGVNHDDGEMIQNIHYKSSSKNKIIK